MMKKVFLICCLAGAAVRGISQKEKAYFIDGYHGGIYGHLPSWQTRFMVDQLAEHPTWKINLELEPESWDSIRLSDPKAYAEFKELYAKEDGKRIEYINPSYGQSYMYNISGESIIRQLDYGMRKLHEHFPTAVFSTYSSEEPCFTSALPGILKSYGFKYASLKNPNTCWGGYTRAFGGELVNWIGSDGSSILTVPRYEMEALKPRSIWETLASSQSEEYVKAAFAAGIQNPVGMCLQDAGWNYGPWLSRSKAYQPTEYQTWRGYFEGIANRSLAKDWRFSQEDVLVGLMWGSQVLQKIARSVRQSENYIIQAEKLASMAGVWKKLPWPGTSLDSAWRTLLLSQHHDCWIVPYNGKPGDTWIDKVERWTGETDRRADEIVAASVTGGSKYIRIYNTTGSSRKEYAKVGDRVILANVPAMGYVSYRSDSLGGSKGSTGAAKTSRLADGKVRLETDLYIMLIDPAKGGAIVSWTDKIRRWELVQPGKAFNELRGNFYNDGGFRSSTENPAEIKVLEDGVVEIHGNIAGSPFVQSITMRQGQARVDMHLRIDWQGNPSIGEYYDQPKDHEVRKAYYDDRFKLLALFPLNVDTPSVVYKDAPFDVLQSRLENTFYNRWDSIKNNVLLNWVDVEDPWGVKGMALYGDHTTSYVHGPGIPLGLTVQYSGNGIFYRNYTLKGPTGMDYALLPHGQNWMGAKLWTEGTKWREPLIVGESAEGGSASLLKAPGLEVSSVRIEGKDLWVRLFNAEGSESGTTIWVGPEVNNAIEVELDGREVRRLKVLKGHFIELTIPRFGFKTIKITHA